MGKNKFYETAETSIEELISYVKEAGAAYGVDYSQQLLALKMLEAKRQGEFTSEDYYEFPEEYNVELIDGVFYKNAAPTTGHQSVTGRVFFRFSNYILSGKGKCTPLISPVDVKIDCDEDTILHPDFLVVCDKDKIRRNEIWGAPDFVLEVISKGTKNRDLILKLYKYQQAGVREYWIIDPMKELLYIYDFDRENLGQVYELTGTVEVGIYGGDLKIDLDEIRNLIREMPEE